MKKVLITSYEGSVFVKCKRNKKRSEVLEIARLYLQEKTKKPILYLNNVSYMTESEIMKEMNNDLNFKSFIQDIETIAI